MNDLDLVYYDKSGKKYLGRRVTKLDYVILDPDTGERRQLSKYMVFKKMKLIADKENSRVKMNSRRIRLKGSIKRKEAFA